MLYELLPLVIRFRDEEGGGLLSALFEVLEAEYEVTEGEIRDFLKLHDPETVRFDLLPLLASFLGGDFPYEFSEKRVRQYVKNLVYMYKRKGTIPSWEVRLREFGSPIEIVELWKRSLNEIAEYSDVRDEEHPYRAARVCFRWKGEEDYAYGELCDYGISRYLLEKLESVRPIHVLVPVRKGGASFEEKAVVALENLSGKISLSFSDEPEDVSDDFEVSFSCVSACQFSCQEKCEITCTLVCRSGCEPSCTYDCETFCQGVCDNYCQQSCQEGGCEEECQSSCQTSCRQEGKEYPCAKTCQSPCVTCQASSETCVTYCQQWCQLEDQFVCNTACQFACQQESQFTDCVEPSPVVFYFGLSSQRPSLDGTGSVEPEIGEVVKSCETECQSLDQISVCRTYSQHPESVLCFYSCQVACEPDCESSCQYSDTSVCWTSVEGNYRPTPYRRFGVDGRSVKRVSGSDLGYEGDLAEAEFFVNDVPIVYSEQVEGWGTFPYFVVFDSPVGGNLLAFGEIDPPLDVGRDYPVLRSGKAVFRLLSAWRTSRKIGDVVFPQLSVEVSFLPLFWEVERGGDKESGTDVPARYRSFMEFLCRGQIDRERLAIMLVKEDYEFDPNHRVREDVIPFEVKGSGYVSLGKLVPSSFDGESGNYLWYFGEVSWKDTEVVNEVGGAVIYSGHYLIAYLPVRKLSGEGAGTITISGSLGFLRIKV